MAEMDPKKTSYSQKMAEIISWQQAYWMPRPKIG
jgi:hypothetical protein